jgi:hypothetical protein
LKAIKKIKKKRIVSSEWDETSLSVKESLLEGIGKLEQALIVLSKGSSDEGIYTIIGDIRAI